MTPEWSQALLSRVRADTPILESRIHLNSCGAGPMPLPVLDVVVRHLREEVVHGAYEAAALAQGRVEAVYASLASLLGASSHQIALFSNATTAWQGAFASVDFRPGDHVLIGQDEYASNVLTLLRSRERLGIDFEVVPLDVSGRWDLQALSRVMKPRTRVISATHASNYGGPIADIASVADIARRSGALLFVDASQTIGQVNLNVKDLGCDVLVGCGRKWLRGPRGTGFLFVSDVALSQLSPDVLDIRSADWSGPLEYVQSQSARRFETWERSVANVLGLGAAADYALDIGVDRIEGRIRDLSMYLRTRLESLPRVRLLGKASETGGIVGFDVEGLAVDALVQDLHRCGINTSRARPEDAQLFMTPRGAAGMNRIGIHYFNSRSHVDDLVEALRRISGANRLARISNSKPKENADGSVT